MNLHDPNRWAVLGQELASLSPELWLVAGMCLVLLWPLLQRRRSRFLGTAVALCLLASMIFALWTLARPQGPGGAIFWGMFVIDSFSQFFKVMLDLVALLVLTQWMLFSRSSTDRQNVPDYLCLLLGAILGMSMMVSAANILMIFIAIETASLPSYVLAGFRKANHLASEASLKYVIFGAAASAIMLYGMSLIYGVTGELDLARISQVIMTQGVSPLLAVGLLGVLAGLAFKLSAVPMHFWTPDVFQGAPLEIATLLSVASKGAAVCLLVRIMQNFSISPSQVAFGMMVVVGLLGAVTATWGNLAALRQNNIRRLLAYSSIAHAGYMIMAASVMVMAQNPAARQAVAGTVLFYLLVYLFMNLGAFTAAGMIDQQLGTQDIRKYAGLVKKSPAIAVLMTIFLLSLFGMPVLGGFMAKIYLAGGLFTAGSLGFVLVVILFANTLLSLFYYLKPAYYMLVASDPGPASAHGSHVAAGAPAMLILVFCTIMLFWTGLLPGSLQRLAQDLAQIQMMPASDQPSLSGLAPTLQGRPIQAAVQYPGTH